MTASLCMSLPHLRPNSTACGPLYKHLTLPSLLPAHAASRVSAVQCCCLSCLIFLSPLQTLLGSSGDITRPHGAVTSVLPQHVSGNGCCSTCSQPPPPGMLWHPASPVPIAANQSTGPASMVRCWTNEARAASSPSVSRLRPMPATHPVMTCWPLPAAASPGPQAYPHQQPPFKRQGSGRQPPPLLHHQAIKLASVRWGPQRRSC